MPWGVAAAAVMAGGAAYSGYEKSKGAGEHINAMREAIELDKRRYDETVKRLAPYVDFGTNQLNSLGTFLNEKTASNYLDPGYEFRREQGMKGLESSAAAGGMLQSGDTLRGLTAYNQDMASQEYNNAFARFLEEGKFRQDLAGMGQNAAAQLGYIGNQSSANIGRMTNEAGYGTDTAAMGEMVGNVSGIIGQYLGGMSGGGGKNYFAGLGKGSGGGSGSNIYKMRPADDIMVG